MAGEAGVDIFYSEPLDRETGVTMQDAAIQSIRTESGHTFNGAMFIDASYEGDLMAAAGVSYTVGRESNAAYGERYNGAQTSAPGANNHNFNTGAASRCALALRRRRRSEQRIAAGNRRRRTRGRRRGRQPLSGLQLPPDADHRGRPPALDRAGRLRCVAV